MVAINAMVAFAGKVPENVGFCPTLREDYFMIPVVKKWIELGGNQKKDRL